LLHHAEVVERAGLAEQVTELTGERHGLLLAGGGGAAWASCSKKPASVGRQLPASLASRP
jgi:hypothetical protein